MTSWQLPLPCFLLITIGTATLGLPPDGSAQTLGSFRRSPELTRADLQAIQKLTREELPGKPQGTTLAWENPASGNSGTVTLLQAFPSRDRHCQRVRYRIAPDKQGPATLPVTYVLTSCRSHDGGWKLDSHARPDRPRDDHK